MVFLAGILAILIVAGVVAFDAYLLSVHIPTLVADPTNFGAWVWTLIAVSSIIGLSTAHSQISK